MEAAQALPHASPRIWLTPLLKARRGNGFGRKDPGTSGDDLDRLLPAFPKALGIRLTKASPEIVCGELVVGPEHANRNGVMHGGAIMGLADAIAGTTASLNLGPGQSTTTVESKTNFIRSTSIGGRAIARSTAIHQGRRTTIWRE